MISGTRPIGLVIGAALLALACTGCTSDGVGATEVTKATTSDGSRTLAVAVSSCNSSPPPTVEIVSENASTVEIRAIADDSSTDDCLDPAEVCLDAPLGDRDVIDDTTGDQVGVDVVSDVDFEDSCPT